ncbi:MAG: DUF2628 domain-containing protein [Cytophagaceae bacterium]|nr:MAG: DUF2628 domain-containing protein [Cytophagaceae bacterium]
MDAQGMLNTPTYRAAVREVPLMKRTRLIWSLLGFLLGPFYFVYLGLWKPMLTLFAGLVVIVLILDEFAMSDTFYRVLPFGFAGIFASTCIPLYYLKHRHGIHRWNPFATAVGS